MSNDGDRSTSGKYLPKSSTCVIDNGELFSLTLILIVPPEKKTMYFTEFMKFLAFTPQHFLISAQASVYEEFIIPR